MGGRIGGVRRVGFDGRRRASALPRGAGLVRRPSSSAGTASRPPRADSPRSRGTGAVSRAISGAASCDDADCVDACVALRRSFGRPSRPVFLRGSNSNRAIRANAPRGSKCRGSNRPKRTSPGAARESDANCAAHCAGLREPSSGRLVGTWAAHSRWLPRGFAPGPPPASECGSNARK